MMSRQVASSAWIALTTVIGWAGLGSWRSEVKADEPPAILGKRVVEGRVLDPEGHPPREGKISFRTASPPIGFRPAWSATIDREGRYRIELTDFVFNTMTIKAANPLVSLVLAPGFRAETGKIGAGPGPSTVDVRLKPEPWKETELRVIDREGAPLPDSDVELQMGGGPWRQLKTDASGLCRFSTPSGIPFGLTVGREEALVSTTALGGTADDPTRVTIPLYAPVVGRVVDPQGQPISRIRIGRLIGNDSWADDPEARLRTIVFPLIGSTEPAVTGQDGRFTLRPRIRLDSRSLDPTGAFQIFPLTVCFTDQGFDRLAFLSVDLKAKRAPTELTLKPGRRVRIPIEHEVSIPSGEITTWWDLNRYFGGPGQGGPSFVMQGNVAALKPGDPSKSGEWIETTLPEGRYQFDIHSADQKAEEGLEETKVDVEVPPGDGPWTVPKVRLTALLHHRLIGQPAPEIDATDLDTGKPVRLADLRGKIVVLDFWGYWCGPCVGSMPRLIEVHHRYRDQPVVILSLHDASVQTRDAYDRKLSGVKKSLWEGRDLPFLVALDRPDPKLAGGPPGPGTGVTCDRYQIKGFPTTMVIDRDGKVVGTVNVLEPGKLDEMIKGLLNPARPLP